MRLVVGSCSSVVRALAAQAHNLGSIPSCLFLPLLTRLDSKKHLYPSIYQPGMINFPQLTIANSSKLA